MKTMFAVLLLAVLSTGATPIPRTEDAVPALRDGRWKDALPVLEAVTAANSFDGLAHYYLGVSYQRLDRHRDAIEPLRNAIALGVNGTRRGMRSAHVASARSLAALGDADKAVHHLETAWAKWGFDELADVLTDEAYAGLHDHPQLKALAGYDADAEAGDRDARWRADLRYLRRLIGAAHANPFHHADAAEWNARADRLDRQIGQLSDLAVISELMQLVASIGDGHTAVYPPTEGTLAWHLLPFYPVWLEDGWFVAAATPEHQALVGGRIVAAAGHEWPEVVRFASRHLARDNAYTERWLAAVGLQFAELYALASKSDDHSKVELVVEHTDGQRTRAMLEAQPIMRNPNAHWVPEGWATAYETAPRWLRDATDLARHEKLDGSGIMYVRLLQTADRDEQSLADFGRQLRLEYTEQAATGLILDVRLNNGGDANEARGLLDELIRIPGLDAPGALAVLTGPRSFSATGYLLGMLEKHLEPVFVGWPSGCRPVGYSSERSFRLPYSGLTGSISYELRVDGKGSDDRRASFYPDYPVWLTGEDLRASQDPVLRTALDVLRPRN